MNINGSFTIRDLLNVAECYYGTVTDYYHSMAYDDRAAAKVLSDYMQRIEGRLDVMIDFCNQTLCDDIFPHITIYHVLDMLRIYKRYTFKNRLETRFVNYEKIEPYLERFLKTVAT